MRPYQRNKPVREPCGTLENHDRPLAKALPNRWQCWSVTHTHAAALAGRLPALHLALGGGGLGGLIIHIIIWHLIWRLIWYVWHIHTFGPYLVVLIIAALVGATIWRRRHGGWGRRRSGGYAGRGTGAGPRDW
jgi:hypothetical protein